MKIAPSLSVKDIKEQFNAHFPYLKIEFYNYEHEKHEGSSVDKQIKESMLLSDINSEIFEGVIDIDSEMTAADFEALMREKFGLNVQVFRKSKSLWLQTSSTDSWTLEKQNGKGERSTLDYDIDPVNISDFDLD
ncbi:MAG: hypothetical protein LC107_06035 [Chitinophagales bacterium]|nr:hypothetical protein [Chitinophagales bacterium]